MLLHNKQSCDYMITRLLYWLIDKLYKNVNNHIITKQFPNNSRHLLIVAGPSEAHWILQASHVEPAPIVEVEGLNHTTRMRKVLQASMRCNKERVINVWPRIVPRPRLTEIDRFVCQRTLTPRETVWTFQLGHTNPPVRVHQIVVDRSVGQRDPHVDAVQAVCRVQWDIDCEIIRLTWLFPAIARLTYCVVQNCSHKASDPQPGRYR